MKTRLQIAVGFLSVLIGIPAAIFLLLQSVRADTPQIRAASSSLPLEAQVYSTMPSTDLHSPVMALDGSMTTYFKSVYGMGDGDDFIVLLSRPIAVQSINVVTGDPDGSDLLTNGVLETSPDQNTYASSTSFGADGTVKVTLNGQSIMSLRIRLIEGQYARHLVIREITINSPDKITRVDIGPGRGFVDYSRRPEVATWAGRAEAQMESFWADTAALLYSPGFITPNAVNVVYRTGRGVTGIAATGGGVMTVNSAWCDAHPDDTALTVHETAHVIQAFKNYDPIWLIEGEADYIRWVKFEPRSFHPYIDVKTATYHDAYQTTAAFLGWCEIHYDNTLVTQLNRAIRTGTYSNGLFKNYCGKDVDTLWAEFIAAYQADPERILTSPGDDSRIIPDVNGATVVPVDLSSVYNTMGISKDGTAVSMSGGLDGEGSTYSEESVGNSMIVKGVKFSLGPAGTPDAISGDGAVVPLPSGRYSSIWLLGTSIDGSSEAQSFTVTFTSGTSQTLVQSLSDWNAPEEYDGELTAIASPYRNLYDGSKDIRPFELYAYGFSLNSNKTIKSLTLPNTPTVKILAISLAGPTVK